MSTPCDILVKALTAQRACAGAPSDRRRPSGLYWYTNPPSFKRIRTYLLFTISYRTSNRQTNVQQAANLVLSVNDVFEFAVPATLPKNLGGGGRDRTDDPLLAKQVLSQLSYAPRKVWVNHPFSQAPRSRASQARLRVGARAPPRAERSSKSVRA